MSARKFLSTLILFSSSALLATQTVISDTDLNNKIINFANTGVDTTLSFQNNITITPSIGALLRPLNTNTPLGDFTPVANAITILGNNFTLNGSNTFRGFFVQGGTVTIENLRFSNVRAKGGDGSIAAVGGGGGGGAGLGGALYVSNGTTVILNNPSFLNSNATGGSGGTTDATIALGAGGGGGGLTGNGGLSQIGSDSGSGGGGFAFNGGGGANFDNGRNAGGGGGVGSAGVDASATPASGGAGGNNFIGTGGGAGGAGGIGGSGSPGASGAGGGGAGWATGANGGNGGNGGPGGGGGGGSFSTEEGFTSGFGGNGGRFGGGGGGSDGNGAGGVGGFGAGGGGGGLNFPQAPVANGGAGGFGGGGGGGGATEEEPNPGGLGGAGGFGGGNGGNGGNGFTAPGGGGGGGAGFGGAIFIENAGSVTINGSATFEGNTVVAGASGGNGAAAGSAAGADIFMMGGAAITFNLTSDVNIPNPIASDQVIAAGGLTKAGCATLRLNGANTYTGTTTVNAGTLRIDGSVVTNILNNSTLTGNFSTPGSITNNGIVSPGADGVGQITAASFTNAPGGTLLITLTPFVSPGTDVLNVGTATLGGTLELFLNSGNYIRGTTYTVVNGPTIGTFNTIVKTGPAAPFVNLQVDYSSVVVTILNSLIFAHQTINPGIPTAVANCIQRADPVGGTDFGNIVIGLGGLTNKTLNNVLYAMSPAIYSSLDWINARDNSLIARILSERVFELRCSRCERFHFWIDGYGSVMFNRKHSNNWPSYRNDAAGGIAGFDVSFGRALNVGIAGGYTHDWINWKNHLGGGHKRTYYGAAYGSFQWSCLDLDFSAIGGKSNYRLHRDVSFQENFTQTNSTPNLCGGTPSISQTIVNINLNRTAHRRPEGHFGTGHVGLAWKWNWCNKILKPYALADYHYFRRGKFTEQGAGSLNLNVQAHNQNMLRGEAGLMLYRVWEDCVVYSAPYISLSWVGEYALGKIHQRGSFTGQTCVIDAISSPSSVQFLSPGLGMKWTNDCGSSFSVGYKGYFNKKSIINEGDIRLEIGF
ncbi:MAG: autotransporter domain-containing protein [Verrucomicrobia bacterium]|nr:autotransporter domain-containing protein [Verrucomicrobiota bacterium]